MTAALAFPGNTAATFLTHFFGHRPGRRRPLCGRAVQGDARTATFVPQHGRRRRRAARPPQGDQAPHRDPEGGPKEMRPAPATRSSSAPASRPAAAGPVLWGSISTGVVLRPQARRADDPLPGRPAGPAPGGASFRPFPDWQEGGRCGLPRHPRKGAVNDLARFHRRNEARRAAGLCLKCGKVPARAGAHALRALCWTSAAPPTAPGLPGSGPRASRCRDPDNAKRYERERSRRLHAERKAAGICTKCGGAPARPERTTCEPCAEKHRARDRARHAQGEGRGDPLWRSRSRKPGATRGRKRSRRRSEARKAAGLCIRCGNAPPAEGRAMCEPCREDRRAAKRARHAEGRAAGLCVRLRGALARRQDLLRSLR